MGNRLRIVIARLRPNAALADIRMPPGHHVEKHINAIFGKLGLTEEPQVDRRVAAVLIFFRDVGQ